MRPATDEALRDGGAVRGSGPGSGARRRRPIRRAEQALLDSARDESMAELRRKAKAVRAAATDDAEKQRRAHAERDLSHQTSTPRPARPPSRSPARPTSSPKMLAFLEPFIQAEFDKARRSGPPRGPRRLRLRRPPRRARARRQPPQGRRRHEPPVGRRRRSSPRRRPRPATRPHRGRRDLRHRGPRPRPGRRAARPPARRRPST